MASQAESSISSAWRREFQPSLLLPSLVTGLVNGAMEVTIALAFAALLFTGDLSGHVSAGVGLMLFGMIIFNGLTALTSSVRGVISSVQDSPVAILALVSVAIVDDMSGTATTEEMYVTVVATLGLTSLLTGIVFLLLGQFKLGNLVRFIPYPVIGGFLAGVGLLLARGAISFVTDVPVSLSETSAFTDSDLLVKWLPGLVFAILLMVILRRYSHFLIIPGMLVATIVVFFVVLALTGTSVSEARDDGWLLDAESGGGAGFWEPLGASDLEQVDWSVLGTQAASLLAIAAVSTVGLLLNATGIELITEETVDLNRELKVTGAANLVAGLGGSPAGYHALGPSVLSHKMGARGRLPGIVVAALCGTVMVAGGSLLSYFPNPLLSGLLLFLGLDMLVTWVYDAWAKLPKTDYAIMILILVVINTIGFLEGVGVGLVLAVILFVVEYSRIDVVKHALSGTHYHSSVVRPSLYEQLLRQKGDWLYILKLQGFIFFGTANKLLDQVRARINDPDVPKPHFIVFDFHRVSGIDSSAVLSFTKIKQLARAQDITLIFTALSPGIKHQMDYEIFQDGQDTVWRIFPDLDHGVEWCEDHAIEIFEGIGLSARPETMKQQLEAAMPDPDGVTRLMKYLELKEVAAEHTLIGQGDPPQCLFFIEQGQVTVRLALDGDNVVRLRKMNAGTVVGELSTYLNQPATASVVTEQPSTLYCLSADAIKRMESDDPEIAAAFHRFMAHLLADRLTHTTTTLSALVD